MLECTEMETWASGIQEGEARQKPTSLNPRVHPHPHAGVENKDKCFKHNHMPGVDAVCPCVSAWHVCAFTLPHPIVHLILEKDFEKTLVLLCL